MPTVRPSLNSLPVEIQCAIYELLDPVDLISVSQTDSQLRDIIKPTRQHFFERLLVLECREEWGGATPIMSASGGYLSPDWSLPECQTMRWACSACLRLLAHTAFDDRSLLRLRYRKPVLGSPAAKLTTSWNPSGRVGRPRRKGEPPLEYSPEEKRTRRRYGLALSADWNRPRTFNELPRRLIKFQECGMSRFEGMSLSKFINLSDEQEHELLVQEALDVESVRCGFKRGLRRCLECRYQRNELNPLGWTHGGTEKVPIMMSRRLFFPSITDRYFPDIGDALGIKRPACNPPVFAVYRESARDHLWLTQMVRCPGCSVWQELRHFRLGEVYEHWRASVTRVGVYDAEVGRVVGITEVTNWDDRRITRELVDGLLCSQCFLQEYGRVALGKELLQWLKRILDLHRSVLRHRVGFGWPIFQRWSHKCPRSFRREVQEVAREPCDLVEKNEENDDFTDFDLALLRKRRQQWFDVRARMIEKNKFSWLPESPWLLHWNNSYDELEAMYVWVQTVGKVAEGQVDALVDWALENQTIQGRTV
ncbi:hypothetical protein N7523_006618 [Penicillium sp. IBT 18751x]|nr:hypothetical protein N7523_006618 [Penicillium sp. IBT 18751x]